MTRYLLDTNHVGRFFDEKGGIEERVRRQKSDEFGLCTPVVAELWFMVFNSQRVDENRRTLERILSRFPTWEFNRDSAEVFGRVKVELRRMGRTVADVDLQIASVALVNNLTLLTADGAFGYIPALSHENWLV